MNYVLETENLPKRYGNIKALTGLSLRVEQGSIFGILGPNGSGKTTTLSIVLDALRADEGIYRWFGMAPSHKTRRQRIGALLETPNFYPYLSAEDNLKAAAAIKNKSGRNIRNVLHITGLSDRKSSPYATYSLGMKQRLAIASALLSNPEALVLDEPTNGLDPQGIAEIRSLIQEISKQGKTIILASHLLDEVEKVCSHVAILKSGELIASGKVSDISGKDNAVEVAAENMQALEAAAQEINGLQSLEKGKHALILKFPASVNTGELNSYFFNKGITLTLLIAKRSSLENLFLEMTSRNA